MAHAQLPVVERRFGETMRPDWWWVQPTVVVLILSAFIVYATWAAFQGKHYSYGPYLSPFYSPELLAILPTPGSARDRPCGPHGWFSHPPC